MIMNEIISIIIPIYNVENYLSTCIESVINQTYNRIEIILVDDGSTDNSKNICVEYAKKDKRIKLIRKKNGGLSDARNKGIELAGGSYLFFLDADDFLSVNCIKDMYICALKYSASIVQCDYIPFTNESTILRNKTISEENLYTGRDLLFQSYAYKIKATVSVCSKLYKSELFSEIRFPIDKIHEDVFTTYRIIYPVNKVVLINKQLYYYRLSPNSIMRKKFNISRLDWIDALEEKLIYYSAVKDDQLYNRTYQEYLVVILKLYYLAHKYLKDNKKIKIDLYLKFKCSIKKIFKMPEIKNIFKLFFCFSLLFPLISGKLIDKIT